MTSGSRERSGLRARAFAEADLLDPGSDEAYDRFTRLAARFLSAPVAQLNLITSDRQLTKSCVGPEPWASTTEVPLTHSYCQHVVASGEPLVIEDARTDPLVRDNRATEESGIVSYAAAPVRAGDAVLGTLCVVDVSPRRWTPGQLDALSDLAAGVGSEIALRMEVAERQRAQAALRRAGEDLERRVLERTAALRRANERVREQVAEIALARERYRSLFDHNPHAVYGFDPQGIFVEVNRAAGPMLGILPEKLVGTSFMSLIAPEEREEAGLLFNRVLAGEPQTYELSLVAPEGRRLKVRGVSVPVIHGGRVRGVIGVAEDVTERLSLEAQLRQSQKMEAVGKLAGGIAHDFNNLITGIRGFAHLLLEEGTIEGDPIRNDLQEIQRAADRAADLTRQLLTFSRKQVLQPKVIDLNEVVIGTEKMLRRIIGRDVEMETHLDPDLGRVLADPGQMEQVIVNLVVNSRDAMPEGGTVTIRTRGAHEGETAPEGHDERTGRHVVVSVSDEGSGIPPEVRERIFEPFFTTKDSGRGTGLGLSTVYGIVKQTGGRIDLETEVGRGSTFEIHLPRTGAVPVRKPPPTPAGPRRGGEVVLLVEDEPAVRSVSRRILERAGYTLLEAASGHEALEVAERHPGPIHLLLADLVMPEMGGREVATRLAASHPNVVVLFMSGYSEDEAVSRGRLDPGVTLMEKPFTPEGLLERVRRALGSRDVGTGDLERG